MEMKMKKILIGMLLVSSLFGGTCTEADKVVLKQSATHIFNGDNNSAVKLLVTPCANKCEDACSLLSTAYYGLKEYDKALPILKDLCDNSRDLTIQADACMNLGNTYNFHKGDTVKAIDAYTITCDLLSNDKLESRTPSNYHVACYNMGSIWHNVGLETGNKDVFIAAKRLFNISCKYGNQEGCRTSKFYDTLKWLK
jgi:tetratricopeptide (TPR) repeat protein